MANWPVIGHEWAVNLLAKVTASGHLSHAYLFTGPAQVGKTTLARAFAQAILCERQTGEPCKDDAPPCRTCRRIAEGRYPDLQMIAAEKNSRSKLIRYAFYGPTPHFPHWRGAIGSLSFGEIERATPPAANALLKTLEEPPPYVILLLTSHRRDLVLPTVLSRCQVIGLRPLPQEQVQDALATRWGVAPEQTELLARLSGGRIGWAIRAHTHPEIGQDRNRRLDGLLTLTTEGYVYRLNQAETLSRQSDAIEETLGLWATWWRDILLIQRGAPQAIINLDRRAQLTQQAELYQPGQVEAALDDLVQTLRRIKANVNVRLALDLLLLRLPKPIVA